MAGKISVREFVYGGWQNAVDYIAFAGIKCFEIEMRPIAELRSITAAIREKGFEVLTLSGSVNLDDDASIAHLQTMIEACGELKIGCFFVSASGDKLDRAEHMTRLRSLGEIGAANNCIISLETHPPFCANAAGMLQTMQEVNHPNVRINFDTANIFYYNHDMDSADELEKIIDYVASLHLKDTDGIYESMNFPVLGEGVVRFGRITEILNAAGFDGPLTMELEGPLVDGKPLDEVKDLVKACVDHVRSEGLID